MASCGQSVPKWVQTLIFCIIVTRNGLNTKHSLHFSVYFTFLSIFVNFLLSGNDMCHSQPKPYSFIISNASRSMHCSSVEAYLLWKCCFIYVLMYKYLLPTVIPNRRHGIFYLYEHLWQEICAINAQVATRTKQQLKWFFQCDLWSLSNSRAPGGPVTDTPHLTSSRHCYTLIGSDTPSPDL